MSHSGPGTISTLQIFPKVVALEALGLDVERILRLAHLPRARFADPNGRLPSDVEFAFWDAAVAVSGDPAIALRVADHIPIGAHGSYEYLLRHAGTLAEAFERADRYVRLIDDLARVSVRVSAETAAMRIYREGGYPASGSEVECLFAVVSRTLKRELPGARFLAMEFTHPAPTDPAIYQRYFGCPTRFECDAYEMHFPAEMLGQPPTRQADQALSRVLEDHARHLLDAMPALDPFQSAVRAEILSQLAQGSTGCANLARALAMSERTLRRRLHDQGTTYQALLDGLRSELAQNYVAHSRDPFEVIAQRLAFADPSAFFRAFRRWTGTTPAQFREQARPRA
jgi:AraC-like DNA-binding protein